MRSKTDITLEEFEQFLAEHGEKGFELIDGRIVEKALTEQCGFIVGQLLGEIYIYLTANPIGRLTVQTRYQVPGDRKNSRTPDIAFTSAERMLPIVKKGAVPQLPDLAIEVQSPDDDPQDMREKAKYYLANGVRLVWLVITAQKLIEIHTASGQSTLTIEDTLNGGAVLPGFTLKVVDVFAE